MRHVLRLAVVLVLAAPVGVAQAQDILTPSGPATVRQLWKGPVTAEGRPPQVLTRWAVTVGAGGQPGPVNLRVFKGDDVVGVGPTEWLPAEPGTYEFPVPVGIPYDTRQYGMALDQQVGGHAIIATVPSRPELGPAADPAKLHWVGITYPPCPEGHACTQRASSESPGQELQLRPTVETDLDGDLVGDQTLDVGDLRVLSARIVHRTADGWYRVEARVRNVGSTVRHRPTIKIPDGHGWQCDTSSDTGWRNCTGHGPLAPGAEGVVGLRLQTPGGWAPQQITVGAEGPDLHPEDNVIFVQPWLTLAKTAGRTPRVSLGASRAGTITLTARIAGLRITRTVTFAKADRRVVRLLPRTRADRRRLARALRRTGRLTATVTATMDGGRATIQARY